MCELLTVPLKRGSDVDLVRPLTRWVSSNYNTTENPIDASLAVAELNQMRQNVVKLTDRGERGLLVSANYYDQISALEEKGLANELPISFKWKDAFDHSRRSSSSKRIMSLSIPNIAYEKACILFNIGALNSWIAADQDLESGEGLQKTLKRLQISAGIFDCLKDTIEATIQQHPTSDMKIDSLGVLTELMVAQAQEIVVRKAINDKMKDGIIAKLCAQCDVLFYNLAQSMQTDKGVWPPGWLTIVTKKQVFYSGLAQYHHSRLCNEQTAIGEEIARLRFAKKLFATLMQGGSTNLCNVKEWMKRTDVVLTNACKDNDCIYSDKIPDEKDLTPLGKAAVAKPSTFAPPLGNPDAPCLFDMLAPIAVIRSIALFDAKMAKLKVNEVDKLREATNSLNHVLSSLNLPAALEDAKGNELPTSLKSKASSIQHAGGTKAITSLNNALPDLANRNTAVLDECERLLMEQKGAEEQIKSQYKDDWNRKSFSQIDAHFQTILKYKKLIHNATMADNLVKDKIEAHTVFLDMLSKGTVYLEATVPSAEETNLPDLPIAQKLREQMDEVENIKAERIVLESELSSINPDMKSVFSNIFSKDGVILEEDVSLEALEREFGPLQKEMKDNINRQDALISKIRTNQVILFKENVFGSSVREEMFKQLAAAHDAYFELKGHAQEGTKFYNDLTRSLVNFQNVVKDFCFALDTEKEDMMNDLTSPIFYDAK